MNPFLLSSEHDPDGVENRAGPVCVLKNSFINACFLYVSKV